MEGQNSRLQGTGIGWGRGTVRGNAESVSPDELLLLAKSLWANGCGTWGCSFKPSRKGTHRLAQLTAGVGGTRDCRAEVSRRKPMVRLKW